MILDAFNCCHQGDLEEDNTERQRMSHDTNLNYQEHVKQTASHGQVAVYQRDDKQDEIRKFLEDSISRGRSGLMYLCGRPGTGKTSSLNYVLGSMLVEGTANFKPFLFNAMTYSDVRSFAIKLHEKLHLAYFGELPKRILDRDMIDDEDMANIIERLLIRISKLHEKGQVSEQPHKVIVIDEVDSFSSNEKAFTILLKQILKSKGKTKTTIVGIANSVDLPFRKKHSAISMRDCQLLFEPYSFDDIEFILEQKKNALFHKCIPSLDSCQGKPDLIKERQDLKDIFGDLIDEPAMRLICQTIS